jgi:plasmid stabilization system protein ParE
MEKGVEVEIKEYALQQLKEEYNYFYTEYSEKYADKFYDSFFQAVERILPHYLSHPECRFLTTKNKSYRNVVWENYLIVYKIKKNKIEVLSLFHTKQNPKRLKKVKRVN